jgi:hypothetical protein
MSLSQGTLLKSPRCNPLCEIHLSSFISALQTPRRLPQYQTTLSRLSIRPILTSALRSTYSVTRHEQLQIIIITFISIQSTTLQYYIAKSPQCVSSPLFSPSDSQFWQPSPLPPRSIPHPLAPWKHLQQQNHYPQEQTQSPKHTTNSMIDRRMSKVMRLFGQFSLA